LKEKTLTEVERKAKKEVPELRGEYDLADLGGAAGVVNGWLWAIQSAESSLKKTWKPLRERIRGLLSG
jgi:hypothetical protein